MTLNPKPTSVFVTYIATTADKLWAALTQGDFTRQYFFGRRMESDWKQGSTWKLFMEDGRLDCHGIVLECDPPRWLAFTWKVDWIESMRALPESKVTFKLEPLGEVVRLTVSEHHDDTLDPKFHQGGRDGWPMILSGLKTLLETGHALPPFKFEKPQE